MAWVAPRTWVTNEIVTATQLNTHVRDNMKEVWRELDYVVNTSDVAVTTTLTTVISSTAITYAGTELIRISFAAAQFVATGGSLNVSLYEDATLLGTIGVASAAGVTTPGVCLPGRRFPAAGTRQYIVKAIMGAGTGTISAGLGMQLRIEAKGG
jgi:hypothetical protein